jgi:tellurite resistance protein
VFDAKDEPDLLDPKLLALVEMMVLAAGADGDFGDDERVKVATSLVNLTSARFETDELEQMIRSVAQRSKSASRLERLEALREVLGGPGPCRVALELALGVMLADGVIRTSEREMIADMAQGLGIDGEAAADLVKKLSSR